MYANPLFMDIIAGIGTDILEIERIKKLLKRYPIRFTKKIFTEKENAYCSSFQQPAARYAVRFCAKEAAVKALGYGFTNGIKWKDFEIFNDQYGKPEIKVLGQSAIILDGGHFITSLSHCQKYASAFVIFIKKQMINLPKN
ncbi:Holo-[acyl-carrier-protein] synthase [Candidatus Clavichlamydia salmonicola]|uniref:holo-ACP synthase n=1 Tax=Candidatus Clavichlamydia salmonicola TaxID=469812 RepID=UPI001891CA26|nr:holo-ACP synthase [Candidatus Clavichlamydia salmonicola]MBF5051192.1 Holo-[acyl-carrier-protein] synthase [Candidatus Clavichlamydia salmonicola]